MENSNKYSIGMLDNILNFWILHKQPRVQYIFTDDETQKKWDELFQSVSSNGVSVCLTPAPTNVKCDKVIYAGFEINFIRHSEL